MNDFAAILKNNFLRVIYTEDNKYLVLMDSETENAVIYKTGISELKCLKVLKGAGTFLSNDYILLFYNDSGYGYFNTDSYLYQISTDKIHPLFLETYEQIINYAKHKGFLDSFFVSIGSGIIKTKSLLILKDDFGGIYFYKISDILGRKELTNFYYLPIEGQNTFKSLLSFDEANNILEFENYSKGIDDNEIRKEILKNAFTIPDKRYKGKSILLFDDLYRSGETLNAAAKILKEEGEVGDIYVLTITKTRTKK